MHKIIISTLEVHRIACDSWKSCFIIKFDGNKRVVLKNAFKIKTLGIKPVICHVISVADEISRLLSRYHRVYYRTGNKFTKFKPCCQFANLLSCHSGRNGNDETVSRKISLAHTSL